MSYMSPEILCPEPSYQGQPADLFAVAVILFVMRARGVPFKCAMKDDKLFKLLATRRSDLFWIHHQSHREEGYFSDDFKDLLTAMFEVNATSRLCIADVIGHPWMTGEIATKEQVHAEFQRRRLEVETKKP